MPVETSTPTRRTLLYVTDLVNDSNESLDLVCELAESHDAHLEMIHVIDIGHTKSSPDAQMSIQFRLETLARRLRYLKRNAASLLLFGSPEEVISRRAKEIKAKLIAFEYDGQQTAGAQTAMVRRVGGKAACPVMVLPSPVL